MSEFGKWCKKCQRTIAPPLFSETLLYAKFYHNNRCPHCDSELGGQRALGGERSTYQGSSDNERTFIFNEIENLQNIEWDAGKINNLLDRVAALDQPLELLAPLLGVMQNAPTFPTVLIIKLLKYGFLDAARELSWSKEDIAPLEVKAWWAKAIELEIERREGREGNMSWNIAFDAPDDRASFWRPAKKLLACEEISPEVREFLFRESFKIDMEYHLEVVPHAISTLAVMDRIVTGVNLNIKYGLGNENIFLRQFAFGLSSGGMPARNAIVYLNEALTTTNDLLEKTGDLLRAEAWKWYREHRSETLEWLQKSCSKDKTMAAAIAEEASKQSKYLGVSEAEILAQIRPPPMPTRPIFLVSAGGLALVAGAWNIFEYSRGPDAEFFGTLSRSVEAAIGVVVFALAGWLVGLGIDLIRRSK